MQICFVNMPIEYYSPVTGGAVSTVIMQMARAMERRGHRVSILTRVGDEATYAAGTIVPVQVRSRNDLNRVQRGLSRIRGELNQWDVPYYEHYRASFMSALRNGAQPDVVIVSNDLVSARYIRRELPQTKVIVWLHNEQGTNQRDLRPTLACTDHILTCSAYIRDWTAQRYGIPWTKFVVAANGVDLDAFYPREGYLEPAEELRVLFLGRIDPNKGPDLAADAVRTLQEEGLPVRLTVAGGLWFYERGGESTDPFFLTLKEKMTSIDARYEGHVTRDKVPELVRNHDVVCVLSRSNEPFGLVALEAMASGCAVIASNRGGLPEACGGAALLVDPDDPAAIAAQMRKLATEPETLNSYKRRSVKRAACASWHKTAEALASVLSGERAEHS